jgi:hypothetical protein
LLFTLLALLVATMPAVDTVCPIVVVPPVLSYGKAGNPIHPRGIIWLMSIIPPSFSKL